MTIVLASNNKGKIKEFKALLPEFEVKAFGELLGDIDIVESGDTFAKNAIIKVTTVKSELNKIYQNENFLIISDDSGISVEKLNNEPNIYSARYSGQNAIDKQNNTKLINNLKSKNLSTSKAYYTACIAISYKDAIYTTHGWMHGNVITQEIGTNGFGYDPLFIPKNYDTTLGQMDFNEKKKLSHRTKALNLAMILIKSIIN